MSAAPRRAPRSFVIISLVVVGLLSAVAGYFFGGTMAPNANATAGNAAEPTAAAPSGADELAGSNWQLSGWSVSAQQADEVTITLSFADGRIGGNSGVNSYGGDYTAAAGSLTIGETMMTLMAGPEPAMQAETTYHELLRQVRGYRLAGDQLTLLDEGGNELLIFSRAQN
jgi:heat shock protein HslJ